MAGEGTILSNAVGPIPLTKTVSRRRFIGIVGALAATALLGAVAVAVTWAIVAPEHKAATVALRQAPASRPAFSRAEEAYIRALWPIHGEVERSTVRLSLGRIFYRINDISGSELKARAVAALATFRSAKTRLANLEPPASLESAHRDYRAAIDLLESSAAETLKLFDDGDPAHLAQAYPSSREASDKVREIGARFWPDEFPPN